MLSFIIAVIIWGVFFAIQDYLMKDPIIKNYGKYAWDEFTIRWSIVIFIVIISTLFSYSFSFIVFFGMCYFNRTKLHYSWDILNNSNALTTDKIRILLGFLMVIPIIIL